MKQPIEVYGSGDQIIDLVYVVDVARLLVDALVRTARNGPDAETTEAGSGRAITVKAVAEKVIAAVGKGSIVHLPMRPGEKPGAVIVAKKPLMDATPLETGLPVTVDYYRELLRT